LNDVERGGTGKGGVSILIFFTNKPLTTTSILGFCQTSKVTEGWGPTFTFMKQKRVNYIKAAADSQGLQR